jgi:hypothetical protein
VHHPSVVNPDDVRTRVHNVLNADAETDVLAPGNPGNRVAETDVLAPGNPGNRVEEEAGADSVEVTGVHNRTYRFLRRHLRC